MTTFTSLTVALLLLLVPTQGEAEHIWDIDYENLPCCSYEDHPEVVWYGNDEELTFERFASYVAPVLWFSPDEPLLKNVGEKGIQIPTHFPFEENPGQPVAYYRFRNMSHRPFTDKPTFVVNEKNINQSIISLGRVSGADLDFFFYYPEEKGFGAHHHDLEPALFKVAVWKRDKCGACPNHIVIIKVKAPAHLVSWYSNELVMDSNTVFPSHLFVEEGKHANCPDKNADGYYTPGYDVNRRVSDAWGVRDTLATGHQFSAGFQTFMAKVRQDEHKVFPPLPQDSPARKRWTQNGEYAAGYNQYVLRPLPRLAAAGKDKHLRKIMSVQTDKDPNWPKETQETHGTVSFLKWLEDDSFTRGLTLAARYDKKKLGISFVFPLLVVKHVEMPFGGYLVNRIYVKNDFRDLAYNLLYAPSASRFVDWYMALGYEGADTKVNGAWKTDHAFMSEAGLKFRANLKLVKAAKFITWMTDWWGIRLGVKQRGFHGFDSLGWVIEVGAGAF